ncbi:hypothetical protein WR25_04100 [Diploscapter pachys]|uniref:Exosome complex component RRP45 n=1 Tax=Diploscapter pachys TaxID=2018661 RepID=A0A2A2J1T2_9BILA|nr:hypothetical protein WR25_04100 [Diploscapter pachys]
MRTPAVATCEKQFILAGLQADLRLDGRHRVDFRGVQLVVGTECGTALCMMGSTKVFAAVTASIVTPNRNQPIKGIVAIDVDMSPMGNPAHEHNRLGDRGQELNSLLEMIIRDSRCIDVESLCIRAKEEVWKLVVNVRILDDCGGLLDCAALASVAALYHYRRPNVSIQPNRTIIHSEWEQALVPLNIYHMPICVTFGFMENGEIIIDPSDRELPCLAGSLVAACNKRSEVCALHQSTNIILSAETIEWCVKKALQRALDLSELVSTVIKDDATKRQKNEKPPGFALTITEEILGSETGINELVAPCTSAQKTTTVKYQPSVIVNEDPLAGERQNVDESDAETAALQRQVDHITATLKENSVQKTKDDGKKEKDELAEVDDLLDGILDDDLEGEQMEM